MSFDGSASVGAVYLAIILVWAATLKLQNRATTVDDFRQLGIPGSSLVARLLPAVELLVAGGLLIFPGWAGVAAFFLLAAFTSILVTIIRSGQQLSCSCFGRSSRSPVTKFDIARNVVLLALAILASTLDHLVQPTIGDLVVITGITAAGMLPSVWR